jgi:hypothetical protein
MKRLGSKALNVLGFIGLALYALQEEIYERRRARDSRREEP